MRESLPIAASPSIIGAATSGRNSGSPWQGILHVVRKTHGKQSAAWLRRVTGAGGRTAYGWIKRPRPRSRPNAERTLAILAALKAEHDARGRLLQQFEFDFAGR